MQKPTRLMNKNFVLLWQGQAVNRLGLQAFSVAMVFWIKHATGSATLMGMMLMLSTLPAVLLSPLGGALADRYSRRRIMVFTDLLSGLAVLTLVGVYLMAPQSTNLILIWLFVVSLITSVMSAFFMPAISAAVPDLVPSDKVAAANSLGQLASQISVFVGQGLGGVLYRILGAPVLFLVNGLTYLFAAVSESFIVIPQAEHKETAPKAAEGSAAAAQAGGSRYREQFRTFGKDILDGLGYVWHTGGLRELVFVSSLISFFTVPFVTLLPFYVEDTLGLSVDWYGFILAAYGVASLVGYAIAGLLKCEGRLRGRVMVVALILSSALYGLVALARNEIHALIIASLIGITGGFVMVNITTLVQLTTPSEIRGRVFGVLSTISGGLAPLAMGLAGIAADLANQNIPLIYLVSGIMMTLLSILVCLSRDLRSFLAYQSKPEEISPEVVPQIARQAG
jgi:DHA3 family macrolide efflux protein-like MFS transporter